MGLLGFLDRRRVQMIAEQVQKAKSAAHVLRAHVKDGIEELSRPIPRSEYVIRPDPILGYGGYFDRGSRKARRKRKRWYVVGDPKKLF